MATDVSLATPRSCEGGVSLEDKVHVRSFE